MLRLLLFCRTFAFVAFFGTTHLVNAQESVCGSLRNHYGPFDYRTASASDKALVERAHFTRAVESLRRGNTSQTAGGDLSYTLGVFPNHPRALLAMVKLGVKEKTEKPHQSAYTIACWLDRAERFKPDDAFVKTIYGIYLSRKGKKDDALKKLDDAIALGGLSPNLDYNIGLVYFDLGEYEKSLKSAQRAYAGGFNLPGLKGKLKRAGKWEDPAKTKPEPISGKPGTTSAPSTSSGKKPAAN